MGHVNELRTVAPVERVCAALSLPPSTYYARSKAQSLPKPAARPRARPARALSENERQKALRVLNSDKYVVSVRASTSLPADDVIVGSHHTI